jgi:glycosyl transferase family 2
MLSICTTIKNRSRLLVEGRELLLFPKCVESLRAAVGEDLACELVVADWHSDDWPLAEWLPRAAGPVPVRILQLDGTFSRGRGLNAAASAARSDLFFFADTDVLLCDQVIRSGIEHHKNHQAYFPILFSYDSAEHTTGSWSDGGFGHCIIGKESFAGAGGWPEYSAWGREDKEFWAAVSARQPAVRERVPGFFHQWHPDDPDWKNRYGERTAAYEATRARVIAAQEEVAAAREVFRQIDAALPAHARYILVDEDRFARPAAAKGRALPFLERNGQYWGVPADDAVAIAELERLASGGARFIVFPWITFWWLDHFSRLREHLRSTSTRILQSEKVVIYDLGFPGD